MAEIELQAIKVQNAETTSSTTSEDICKICHCGSQESGTPLITPCLCAGSIKFVHEECLIMKWVKTSTSKTCELCKHKIATELKPFAKWERINLTEYERGNLLGRAISLIIVAPISVFMVWGYVKSMKSWNNEVFTMSTVFLTVLIIGMLYQVGCICCGCIGINKKWMAQNSIVVVQEVPQV